MIEQQNIATEQSKAASKAKEMFIEPEISL
jgi:hypothetical protein